MNEKIDRILAHYENAKEKHPTFADSIMVPMTSAIPDDCGMKYAILATLHNRQVRKLWRQWCKIKKHSVEQYPSVQNILDAEIYEIYAAVAIGDLEQARYEIFDAIAVLLRLDDNLAELYAKEMHPTATA